MITIYFIRRFRRMRIQFNDLSFGLVEVQQYRSYDSPYDKWNHAEMAEHSTVGLESLGMYEILKTEKFAMLFSFIIGFGAVAMLIPVCKGDECFVKKAPSIDDMKSSTYRIGSKCYQFAPETIPCPATGVIESFVAVPVHARPPTKNVPSGFLLPMSF